MSDHDASTLDCGKTLSELTDYLEAGRRPYDPEIETCPGCLSALESLDRLSALSRELLAFDADRLPTPGWLDRVMAVVHDEVRSGRELPLRHPDARGQLTISEGAVRALLRSAGDGVDGLVVTRTRIVGDAERPGAPVEVELTVSAEWGRPLNELSQALREVSLATLERHTDLTVAAVNVSVADLHVDLGSDPA